MILSSPKTRRRRGHTLVETAMVICVFMAFVFGIFEYCRYLLVLHVTTNAARDAARHASVRASFPEATTGVTQYNTGNALPFENSADVALTYKVPFVENMLLSRMAGMSNNISNFQIRVFAAESALLYSDPPVIRPKTTATAWNSASFSERIAVQVVGIYQPFVSSVSDNTFVGGIPILTSSVNFNVIVLVGSEG
ncbi:MAG: TadE/TadG family type IV pilus assembly protein [Fimbriiglobus sp.]